MPGPLALARKVRDHLRLLRDDPEKFAANLQQFTNPARFQARLADIMTAAPLHVRVDPSVPGEPALNVLQPILSPISMTGGPNTIINIAYWVARLGIRVRVMTTREAPDVTADWFRTHLASVTGDPAYPPTLSVVSAADPNAPFAIGTRDMFLATHWTTAQQVKSLLPLMDVKRFVYLIQDFEPGFYAWSSNYALALETYGLDHIGVFNESLLHEYLVEQKAGRYRDPEFAAASLVFEPAIDRALFRPRATARTGGKRRLLFYARPTNPRNMFGLGLQALREVCADPVFQDAEWEFQAIGGRGSVPPVVLRPGVTLTPAPWQDYRGYAELLRESDILLSLMLSPHTSYPVLEMAASGGIAVTNTYDNKTAARMTAISPNIIARSPTLEGVTAGLLEAARAARDGIDANAPLHLPSTWRESLGDAAAGVARLFRELTAA